MADSVQTVNAAATAIMDAESRVQQVTSPRRRWSGWLSMYWCFGSQRQGKRVNHAVVIPDTAEAGEAPMVSEYQTHTSSNELPMAVPPSSPASVFQSEPSSVVHSPVGLFSLSSLSASGYFSGVSASMFTIGPYAYETQLVSPPAFTTEPSTASFTPPPESVHQTNPPSPEVPFAELLMSSLDSNFKKGEGNEFYTYQLYPGSPIGHRISPSSVRSGTSSPFPDLDFYSSLSSSLSSFPISDPPKLLAGEDLAMREIMPIQSSRNASLTLNKMNMTDLDKDVSSLDSNFEKGEGDEFYTYQLYPGSPIGHRISPSSVCSGTSSPFPDPEFHSSISSSLSSFPISDPPKLLAEEDLALRKKTPIQSSRNASLTSNKMSMTDLDKDVNISRLSFELTQEAPHCLEKETAPAAEEDTEPHLDPSKSNIHTIEQTNEVESIQGCHVNATCELQLSKADRAVKEFKFDNSDGTSEASIIVSDWWANDIVSTEANSSKNWTFFPIKQPGVS